jgi:hypothetical protein
MDSSYETFLGGSTKPAQDRISVTINSQNVISLNANCYRLMGKPEAVKLAFSRDLQTIAVTPCSPRLGEAFPVQTKGETGRRINAAPFCRHFRIHIDSTLRFLETYMDPEGTLHLDLRKVVSVAQVRRKRAKAETRP